MPDEISEFARSAFGAQDLKTMFNSRVIHNGTDLGVVRIEMWPEGLVLWVGGEIKWKSWER